MRRHAKVAPAGSTDRQAARTVDASRGTRADRAESVGGTPSSAYASKRRTVVLGLAVAAFLSLALVPLAQSKVAIDGYGDKTSRAGGDFGAPSFALADVPGIAFNTTGAGGVTPGTFYALHNAGGQSRVQRFSPSVAFERTWGWNVQGRNEVLRFAYDNVVIEDGIDNQGGSFTLTVDGFTTAPLTVFRPSDSFGTPKPTPLEVQEALEALPSVGAGNVKVAGPQWSYELTLNPELFIFPRAEYRVEFINGMAGTDVPQVVGDSSQLIGDNPLGEAFLRVSTDQDGGGGNASGFEICTVAAVCTTAEGTPTTANGGAMRGNSIAVNQSTGHVYVNDAGNRRIQEFDPDGNFVRLWGWDVIVSGAPNDTGTGYEICDTAAPTPNVYSDCKNGSGGSNGGQLGAFGESGQLIADSSGDLWLGDAPNRRVQQFDSSGNFIAAYGFNVNGGGALEKCTSTAVGACQAGTPGSALGQFSEGSPRGIAFDADGNLYATDAGNNRVQKLDPTLSSASVFGAAALADFTTGNQGPNPTVFPEEVIASEEGNGLIFVVRNNVFFSEPKNPEWELVELDPTDGSLEDTSLVNAKIQSFNQGGIGTIAWEPSSGDVLASIINSASPRGIIRLSSVALADPGIVIDPVTVKTDSTATLTGTVDPMGGWVRCRFEYSTDQTTWKSVTVPGCESLALGGGPQPVSASVNGLEPNTHYFLRLGVSRPLVAGSTKFANGQFDTSAVAPSLSHIGPIDIRDSSARLVGTIDPRNSATEYVFEYGTTPSFGSSTLADDVGDGATPITVSRVVEGLSPDTTYHFRLVATNDSGSATSSTFAFTTRATPIPARDDRAWEQVSPPEKNGAGALSGADATATAGSDGEAIQFASNAIFGDPPGVQPLFSAQYVARRGPAGWETEPTRPQMCRLDLDDSVGPSVIVPEMIYSADLRWTAFTTPESQSCKYPPLSPDAPLPSSNLYREDLLSSAPAFDLLATERNPVFGIFASNTGNPIGGSADFSHVIYKSAGQQTPDAPPPNVDGQNAVPSVFEWVNGTVRLVSKDESGNAIDKGATPSDPRRNAVSEDGTRIFFRSPLAFGLFEADSYCETAGFEPCNLFMRENGTSTYEASESECTSSCSTLQRATLFRWASTDGSRVAFVSRQKLTNDFMVGAGLYLYTHSANPESDDNLTLVSIDDEPADGKAAGVLGTVGVSDDLETIFFVSAGQVVSGESTAPGPKLYRWSWNDGNPTTDYLTHLKPQLTGGDAGVWSSSSPDDNVTPDGRYLMIQSHLPLEPVADHDATVDVFRWDEINGWACISCQLPGKKSNGHASGPNVAPWGNVLAGGSIRRGMTDDGQRLFFVTPDALLPEDVNDDIRDVYEWHDGRIELISSGSDEEHSRLIGTTADGRDVFIHTEAKLVGWDTDDSGDIYDARIGGGFPEPPPDGNLCEGEACRDAGTVPPDANGAGSAVFEGPKNSSRLTNCPRGTKRVTAKNRQVCVKRKSRKRRARNRSRRKAAHTNREARR